MAVALLAAPSFAAAQQDVAVKVFNDFASDGRIDPCKHTSAELEAVKRNIPPDIEQYAPDYPAAVDAALEARARGECARKKKDDAAPAAPVAPPAATPSPAAPAPTAAVPGPAATTEVVPEPPQPETAAAAVPGGIRVKADPALERAATATPSGDAPLPVLALVILAGALAAALAAVAMLRRTAPERLAGARHAWGEAAYRFGGTWGDFLDWVRFGR